MNRVSDVDHVFARTRLDLRAWEATSEPQDFMGNAHPVQTRIYVELRVDAMTVGQAQGATLGEALLHLGGLMLAERLIPVSLVADAIAEIPGKWDAKR